MDNLKDKLMKKLTGQLSSDPAAFQDLNKVKSELKNSKQETDEATGSGSAGGFEAPLFSKPKKMDSMFKDEQPKTKVKGGYVEREEIEEKWSQKYKKSINCNNPKGFSQRAHCQGRKKKNIKENLTEAERTFMAKLRDMAKKYAQGDSKDTTTKEKIEKIHQELKREFAKGIKVEKEHKSGDPKQIALDHLSEDPKYYSKLKKVETKEATGAGSSGSYESPAFGAKSMSPKDWRGKSKTQIPGGQFVEVKKKCKTFPYCNQGDINALKLSESKTMKRIIKNLSEKHGISESMVRDILIQDSKKNKK